MANLDRDLTEEEAAAAEQTFLASNQPDPSKFNHHLRDPNVITPEENLVQASLGTPFKATSNPQTGEIDLTMSTGISASLKKELMETLQNHPEGFMDKVEELKNKLYPKSAQSPASALQTMTKPEEMQLKDPNPQLQPAPRMSETSPREDKIFVGEAAGSTVSAMKLANIETSELLDALNSALDCMNAIVTGKKLADILAIEKAIKSYRLLHELYKSMMKVVEDHNKLVEQQQKMSKKV